MPTYDFKCKECGHSFSVVQRVVDPVPGECPSCGEKDVLEKVFFSAPGISFKGPGWFKTDGKY